MSRIIDLHHPDNRNDLAGLVSDHAEQQKYAFWSATEIMERLAQVPDNALDDRNRLSVLQARALVEHYYTNVVGKL